MALAEAHEPADEGDINDDWWYSLSPHYRNTAEPEWSGWRLRVRPLLRDQPLSQRFRERLEALHRSVRPARPASFPKGQARKDDGMAPDM